jgi:hypothetical protein
VSVDVCRREKKKKTRKCVRNVIINFMPPTSAQIKVFKRGREKTHVHAHTHTYVHTHTHIQIQLFLYALFRRGLLLQSLFKFGHARFGDVQLRRRHGM